MVRRRIPTDTAKRPAKRPGDASSSSSSQSLANQMLSRSPALRAAFLSSFSRYRALPGWTPNIITSFCVLALVRVASATMSGIEDCDETYNYWEPLHYLVFGYGLETWEYSPEFALRSYTYLLPFAAVAKLIARATLQAHGIWQMKKNAFYAVRIFQALGCTAAETYLYDSIVWRFGKPAARLFLAFVLASPGIFRASVELLPSSFAMIVLTAATASWLVGEFERAVLGVAVAAIIGWPFVAAIAVPMAFHIIMRRGLLDFTRWTILSGIPLFLLCFGVDSYFYGKPVIAPLNLVIYNVFPKSDAGPDLFGVEDWKYYAFNMLLNLNFAAALLILYPLLWVLDGLIKEVWTTRSEAIARIIFLSPCFIWLFIMGNQPHKEERFLAPVYTLVAMTSAVCLNDALDLFFSLTSSRQISHEKKNEDQEQDETEEEGENDETTQGVSEPRMSRTRRSFLLRLVMKNAFCIVIALASFAVGAARIAAVLKGYGAPIALYTKLSAQELRYGTGPSNSPSSLISSDINICVGKEWYRFPSNFFLPGPQYRLRFIRSNFKGLLPKYFAEKKLGSRMIPKGMNMYNKEDPGQYFNHTENCHYFIDLDLSTRKKKAEQDASNPIPLEDQIYIWEEDFLWAERTKQPYRSFFVPGVTEKYWKYAKYRIYRNRNVLPMGKGN